MNIKRIGNIILEVKDLDTSIKFYHEVLGMPIKNERRNWVDLGQESGGVLSLHPASLTTSNTETSKGNWNFNWINGRRFTICNGRIKKIQCGSFQR